jgi:geranylgeranyl diphosphate synthase type I
VTHPVDPTSPASLAAIGDRVAARIDETLADEATRWAAVDPAVGDAFASLRTFVAAGGKRLRPAFCHWGYVAAGGRPDAAEIIDAGAALELVHTCALIHDDIVDGSARRRGLTCLQVDYAGRHRDHEWRGDPRRFGDGAALLVGDLAFVYADQFLRGAPPTALEVFTELRIEVNVGQLLDLFGTATGEATVAQARAICVYKSGKYTVERPLHLGAALAGRLDELGEPLSRYGIPLGEAFQLRDDLLGAFGDDNVLGKGVGEDFREGKPTALYALALERATAADAVLLRDRFGRADLTGQEAAAIQDVFVRTGARAEVESMVAALADQAVTALAAAPMAGEARRELEELAGFVVGRHR